MHGAYICFYLHNSGAICGKSCMPPDGCHLHYKAKKRFPCSVCCKPTASASGRCPLHIRGFYVSEFYHRARDKKRFSCSECCRPTASASGRCPLHIRELYVAHYYHTYILFIWNLLWAVFIQGQLFSGNALEPISDMRKRIFRLDFC